MSLNALPGAGTASPVPVVLVAVLVLVTGAAAVAATAAYFELRPPPAPPGAVSVTDDFGRVVSVPFQPARVIVLGPSILDILVSLGLRGHVVGVDCYAPAFGGLLADYNPDQVANWSLDSSMCVQTGPTFSTEELLNLTPQLVLASTIVSASAVQEITTSDHIPVVMLQPSTVGGIEYDVGVVGLIYGEGGAASALNAGLQSTLGHIALAVSNLIANGTPLPAVLLTYYATPQGSPEPGYWTFGPGTFGQSLLELAGAASISANATTPYPELSGSEVLADNPWGILCGTGFGLNVSSYAQGPDWTSIGAVQAGHVWGVDSTLLTEPDPTMIRIGLPLLVDILHPGLLPA